MNVCLGRTCISKCKPQIGVSFLSFYQSAFVYKQQINDSFVLECASLGVNINREAETVTKYGIFESYGVAYHIVRY